MPDVIESARAEFLRVKDRLAALFQAIPDERINWSPSPTARTPVQLVAHCAWAIRSLHETMKGNTFATADMADADRDFREWEQQWTTREEALDLLETNSSSYVDWLDDLSEEDLQAMVELPFGLGSIPLSAAITIPAIHTQSHIPQLEYIQTIYGDRVWR